MNLILYNVGWMSWNIFLALLSAGLGKLSLKVKPKLLHAISIFVFLLFIPNTIYIVTDLAHLFQRWNQVVDWVKIIITFQYLIFVPIGFVTFIYSMRLLEKNLILLDKRLKNKVTMILMNFVVVFGVVIGRVQRANSWQVLTNPLLIIDNIIRTVLSVELMVYVVLLAVFCNILYFAVRKMGVGERT